MRINFFFCVLLALVACAPTTRFPEHSIQTAPSTDGWSLVTEPGWFHVELPGRIEEGTAVHAVQGTSMTLKQLVGKSSSRFAAVQYAEFPLGFDATPEQLVSEMQRATFGPDAPTLEAKKGTVGGYAFTDTVFDVPPRTQLNPSTFQMSAHLQTFANAHRIMFAIDIRAKGDTDDRVAKSFATL